MDIVDDRGNLFGVINIIDAAVVLMIVAVGVSGIALVLGGDTNSEPEPEPEPEVKLETTNLVLDMGSVSTAVAGRIERGDTYDPDGLSNLTVTDRYLTPDGDNTRVVLHVQATGEFNQTEDRINYRGSPLQIGRNLDLITSEYGVSGQIIAVGRNATLDRQQTTVLLHDTLPASQVASVDAGDEIRVAGQTVATVKKVDLYPTRDTAQDEVLLEVNLQTYQRQGQRQFGTIPIRRGQTINLDGDGYSVAGSIEHVGSEIERQQVGITLTDTVGVETVEQITVGDSSTIAGESVGTIESVSVLETEQPDQRRVIAGVSLSVVEYGSVSHYGKTVVRPGASVTFRTADYALDGRIVRVKTTEPPETQISHPPLPQIRNCADPTVRISRE